MKEKPNELLNILNDAPNGMKIKHALMRSITLQQCNNMQRDIETKSQVIKRIYSRDEITKNQLFFASKLESDVKQIHALITLTRDYVSQCDLMFSKMTIMIGDLIARDNDLMTAIENMHNVK